MEVEEIGTGRGGLEQGDRIAPMVAVGAPEREIMPAGKSGEVAGRDEAAPRDIFEVGGELRPEGGFERDLLAYGDDPEVGQCRLGLGDAGVDLLGRVPADRDGHMMLAEPGAARGDLVLGVGEIGAEADRFVFGRAHASQREVHPPQGRLALDEPERLRDGEFEWEPEQFIEHARAGLSRIILDRNQPDERARRDTHRAKLDRLLPEADPAHREIGPDILGREQHRLDLAVDEGREELERLGGKARLGFIDAEQAWFVASQRRDQRLTRRVELPQFLRDALLARAASAEEVAHAVQQADAALQRTADEGQVKVVDVELAPAEPFAPDCIQLCRKGVVELAVEFDLDAAPDDMVVEREAGRADRL